MAAGIDHFKTGIAETAGKNSGTAVVSVEARFGNHYANFSFRHITISLNYL
jgi:hypothetical protein